jgi:hypothetical protein
MSIVIKRLIDIMDIYQLEQIITEPTRVTIDTLSLIDVFITNIPSQKVKYSGVIRLGISDHYMIYVCSLPKTQSVDRLLKLLRLDLLKTTTNLHSEGICSIH